MRMLAKPWLMAQKELREVRARQRGDTLIERWRRNVIDKVIPKKRLYGSDLTMKKQFSHLYRGEFYTARCARQKKKLTSWYCQGVTRKKSFEGCMTMWVIQG